MRARDIGTVIAIAMLTFSLSESALAQNRNSGPPSSPQPLENAGNYNSSISQRAIQRGGDNPGAGAQAAQSGQGGPNVPEQGTTTVLCGSGDPLKGLGIPAGNPDGGEEWPCPGDS